MVHRTAARAVTAAGAGLVALADAVGSPLPRACRDMFSRLHPHGAQDRSHGRADDCLRHLRALHGDAD
ncbi:hypothetical protein [Streptomyces erythrochromogenes]|uniref:hypothetical protein n=1 Tax=Streptomyces erythrochromogenes TaxID=285574 RepID=UPI0036C979A0